MMAELSNNNNNNNNSHSSSSSLLPHPLLRFVSVDFHFDSSGLVKFIGQIGETEDDESKSTSSDLSTCDGLPHEVDADQLVNFNLTLRDNKNRVKIGGGRGEDVVVGEVDED